MHLVGYLYEDYHDARSLEHKDIMEFITVGTTSLYSLPYSDLNHDGLSSFS